MIAPPRRGDAGGAAQIAAVCDGVPAGARGQPRVISERQSSRLTGPVLHSESDSEHAEDAVSARSTRKSAGEDGKAESVESSFLCLSNESENANHGWKFSRWLHTDCGSLATYGASPSAPVDGKHSADAPGSRLSRLVEAGTGGKKMQWWSPSWCLPRADKTRDTEKSQLTPMMILVVVFTSLTGLLMGYDLCVVAVVLSEIQKQFQLCGVSFSCASKSMVVAILAPGAAVSLTLHQLASFTLAAVARQMAVVVFVRRSEFCRLAPVANFERRNLSPARPQRELLVAL